jgi:hypothetical protein
MTPSSLQLSTPRSKSPLLGALTFGLGMLPFAIVAGALWIFGVVDAYAGSRRIHRVGFRA